MKIVLDKIFLPTLPTFWNFYNSFTCESGTGGSSSMVGSHFKPTDLSQHPYALFLFL